MDAYGINGKILSIDLSRRAISIEKPDEVFYRTYWGGSGFTAYYQWKEVPPGADPLGPENVLVFAAGPLTGQPIPGFGRHSVGSKSPLTGGFGDSQAGGFWGTELKRSGVDAIIVKGRAEYPVYIWVHDGEAEIRDARHLWGLPTAETQSMIRAELGDERIRVAHIGPGGERQVRFACINNDLKNYAGRGGMGAVMGSKKLKAIALRGHNAPKAVDPEKIRELARWLGQNRDQLAYGLYDAGTGGGLVGLSLMSGLPTLNFREGQFDEAERIGGQTLRDTLLIDRDGCFACPIRCKRVVAAKEPWPVDPVYGGPEYESLAALGSLCGVSDLKAIVKANELCGAYTIDTISTGVTIAFAMECFENGLLTKKDTDGLELRFGNAQAVLEMIERIARRQGIGDLLAEGTLRAAKYIGRGAERLAMHVKGQEVPMHEPRLKHGLGVGYAISPTGADHCHNVHDTEYEINGSTHDIDEVRSFGFLNPISARDLSEDKVRLLYYVSNWRHFENMAVKCWFVPWTVAQMEELVRATTGWNTTALEMFKAGVRTVTLARLFNLREGFTVADDTLPERFFQAFRRGTLAGVAVPPDKLKRSIHDYYELMGWDRDNGVPTKAHLFELGLGWVVPEMKAMINTTS